MTTNLYGQSPQSWVDHVFQNKLGRAPDAQGQQYYGDQLQSGGLTPADMMRQVAASPEGTIYNNYQQFTGRAPDTEGWAYWGQVLDEQGPQALRQQMMATPESQDYLLGDGFRDWARASTNGINQASPFVFSDYAALNTGNPQANMNLLYPPQSQSNQMVQGILDGLVGTFTPKKEEEDGEKDKMTQMREIMSGKKSQTKIGGQ